VFLIKCSLGFQKNKKNVNVSKLLRYIFIQYILCVFESHLIIYSVQDYNISIGSSYYISQVIATMLFINTHIHLSYCEIIVRLSNCTHCHRLVEAAVLLIKLE